MTISAVVCRASVLPSRSHRGNRYDNVVAESFFSRFNKARVNREISVTRKEARADLFDCIEVLYNQKRCHSHLNQISSRAFEYLRIGILKKHSNQ